MALLKGIACGGQYLIDRTKKIDQFPAEESVAMVLAESMGGGGGAYNVLIDLAKFDATIPLAAVGLVGHDNLGDAILNECAHYRNIDVCLLRQIAETSTSYTDVYSVRSTGKRTFFHFPGVNRFFGLETVDFNALNMEHFHLAYLTLLDSLDEADTDYGRKSARFLFELKKQGITTSLDLVSLDRPDFADLVKPALFYTDYCIINDFEAEKLTEKSFRHDTEIDLIALEQVAKEILRLGVHKWVVIHFPEGAYAITRSGEIRLQPSLLLPRDYIVGATGAGDAFCAGILYGLYRRWSLDETLRFAVCAGARNLHHITSTGAMVHWEQIRSMEKQFPYRRLDTFALNNPDRHR